MKKRPVWSGHIPLSEGRDSKPKSSTLSSLMVFSPVPWRVGLAGKSPCVKDIRHGQQGGGRSMLGRPSRRPVAHILVQVVEPCSPSMVVVMVSPLMVKRRVTCSSPQSMWMAFPETV